MEENKKKNFFEKVWTSIVKFENYIEFATEKIGTSISYIVKLMLIFAILTGIGITCKIGITFQRGVQYFKENIPNLEFKENQLLVETQEPIIIENVGSFPEVIIIDTDPDTQENTIEKSNLYENGILILKDKIILRNAIINEQVVYDYAEIAKTYNISNFTKTDVIRVIEDTNLYVFYGIVFISMVIYLFSIQIIMVLLDILMFAIFGFFVSRIARIKLNFSAIYKISVHAITLPVILNILYIIVNTLTGFYIKYFQWMYSTISLIYVIVAILMIKTDVLNRQKELIELAKEQQKIREEMDRKSEEEEKQRQQEEQRKREKEQEKKEENNESKDENKKTGEEPEGANA